MIRRPPRSTYKAPDPLLPSPVSVLQDTTIETHSKGKQTFPLKVHYPNPVFHSKIIPNTTGNILELREERLRRRTSYSKETSRKRNHQYSLSKPPSWFPRKSQRRLRVLIQNPSKR